MSDIKIIRTINGAEFEAVLVAGVWYYTDAEGLVLPTPVLGPVTEVGEKQE